MKIIKRFTTKEFKNFTRELLEKEKLSKYKKDNYNKEIIIIDNKYRIFIEGANTTAEKESNPMNPLKESEMPQYIYDFVF